MNQNVTYSQHAEYITIALLVWMIDVIDIVENSLDMWIGIIKVLCHMLWYLHMG